MGAGFQRRRRRLDGVEVKALHTQIKKENYVRLEAVADARGVSIARCVDEMVEADWKKRESNAPRGIVQQLTK